MRQYGFFALALVALALTGCGGDIQPTLMDGGTDADVEADAATDGGDVPTDAPPDVDGGTVSPIAAARNEAFASLMSVELARDAIDASMRIDALHLVNDLLVARLDAIIGEKGLVFSAGIIGEKGIMTALSLPTSAVPTIVIVRNLAVALERIASLHAVWSRSTDPALLALATALDGLEAHVTELHTLLQARFREIIETITVPTETTISDYRDARSFSLVPDSASFHVIAEGAAPTDPTATLTWSCVGVDAISIQITDDETGLVVLDLPTETPSSTARIPLVVDHASSLWIQVGDGGTGGPGYETCDFVLTGVRGIRGTRFEVFPGELAELGTRSGDISARLSMIEGSYAMARVEGLTEVPVVDVVESYLRERLALSGRWRALPRETTPQYVGDDLEMAELELGVLDAVGLALESSAPLNLGTGFVASSRGDLIAIREHDAPALALVAEGDTGPATF